MNELVVFSLLVIALLVFLASGLWVSFALGLVATLGVFLAGMNPFQLAVTAFGTLDSFILSAVPMFILMAEILVQSGVTRLLYRAVSAWVTWLPGELLHANIIGAGIFSAISGSSTATAAAIGSVALPELLDERHYNKHLVFGSLAAGGTLGILIPPSIPLIIYGSLGGVSVGALFLAGILPGIMLMVLYSGYIMTRTLAQPKLRVREHALPLKARIRVSAGILPSVLLIVLVLGSIYGGVATPTEAAGVGATGALLIALAYRKVNFKMLKESAMSTVVVTSMVLFIVMGANIMTLAFSYMSIPARLAEIVIGTGLGPWQVFIAVMALYLILGCLMDGLSMMLLTWAVVYPLIIKMGFNPVWFAIVMVIQMEISCLTPPVGLNLFVIHGLRPTESLNSVVAGSVPFFLVQLVGLTIIVIFPGIALWLPRAAGYAIG